MHQPRELLLGTRKGLMIYTRSGDDWSFASAHHVGIPVPYAMRDPRTGTLWASLDHGHWGQKLRRSRGGADWDGETWDEIAMPAYPEGAEIKPGEAASLSYLWLLAPGRDPDGRELFAGTEPGGLFRSADGGDTFELVEGLWNHPSRQEEWFGGGRDHPAVHSIVFDSRDSQRMLVGISCAGVFETTDDGASWTPRNRGLAATFLPDPDAEVGHDPHLLAMCDSAPDVLWQQNHCGIFRSVDGGAGWEDVSESGGPASFGFAIAADPDDADCAWVVPAVSDECRVAIDGALCVSRTGDGGRTWTALRDGLPQKGCYDVVFRHALDAASGHLAFGTTTGNVFVSADRGERWTTLSHHLPPVYSVRFSR